MLNRNVQTEAALLERSQHLFQAGKYGEAIVCTEEFFKNHTKSCDLLYIQAMCYMQLGEYQKGLAVTQEIKKIDQDHIGAYMAEAYIYKKQGRFIKEESLLRQIILHIEKLQLQEKSNCYQKSLSEAWSMLGSVYTVMGQPEKALEAFLSASHLELDEKKKIQEYSNALFVTNYMESIAREDMKKLHAGFQKFFSSMSYFPQFAEPKHVLRIGYISPDFRQHPVAYFILPLLKKFNKQRFEIYCYAANPPDDVTVRLQSMATKWRNIDGWESLEIAKLIYEDRVDILIDLSGHTKGSCLPVLAHKPAPVQVTGIGYFNTTGLAAVDYVLTDVFCDPPGNGIDEFTEKLIRLPYSHFCYAPLQVMPTPREAPVKRKGYITFGCFNNFNKVTDQILFVWQRILQRTPNSKLVLKSQIFDSEEGRGLVQSRLTGLGFHLESVELRGFSRDYLEQYKEIDIALDTFPYTGGATTCEALYMGVPVITLCGDRHGSRFGYSLLKNAGLDELIAIDKEEYVEKTLLLAHDSDLLDGLHQNLRNILMASDLMNEEKYVDSVEQAYQTIWQEKVAAQKMMQMSKAVFNDRKTRLFSCIAGREYRQAEALVKQLLQNKPDDKELLEVILGVYIETNQAAIAHEPLRRLNRLYPCDGYGLFLAARLDYMENKWVSTVKKAEYALQHCHNLTDEMKSLLYNILGAAYKDSGEANASISCYLRASQYSVTWQEKVADYSNYLFNLHYLSEISVEKMLAAHEQYNQFFTKIKPYVHQKRNRGKIRIGYISPDFRRHVVTFFSYALFKYYDRAVFEVTCYAKCEEDAISEQIRKQVDCWRNIKELEPREAAGQIFADGIDILFDLSGHTRNNCLPIMAYKPAPVQICGIGYFDTTGLKTMDYFLGDIYTDPVAEAQSSFTEQVLRLQHSHFCYVPPEDMPDCAAVPYKKNGYITFGSFNNFTKTTDEMLALWQQILDQVPDSRLLLKSKIFGSEEGCDKVKNRLQKMGFSLDRVEMRPESREYLREYSDVDIALDTYPYPGGGTTCDALYMGVPVITLAGDRHGSRFGYSLLQNLNLLECCAFSKEEYVTRAVQLAQNKKRLQQLHAGLRAQMQASPLLDGVLYMSELEQEYIKIIKPFCLPIEKNTDNLLAQLQDLFLSGNWEAVVQTSCRVSLEAEGSSTFFSLWAQAYFKLGDYGRGIQVAKEALENGFCWEQPEFFIRLGNACKEIFAYTDAAKYFSLAITGLKKVGLVSQQELLLELKLAQAQLLVSLGETTEGAQLYQQVSEEHPMAGKRYSSYGSYLLSLHYQEQDATWLYKEHCRYNDFFQEIVKYKHHASREHKKIRIGYLSPDFHQHVMFYFYHVLLVKYDKTLFEVYCYSLVKESDSFTEYLKPFVTVWKDVSSLTEAEIAKSIYDDEIDILVDLAGHSAGSGLASLAYKPAPLQISGLGYVNTTGLSTVDYFITDEIVDPPEAGDRMFSEKLLRLPKTQFCYTGRSDVPLPCEAPFQKNGYITFGSFNNFAKITDNMLALWLKVMKDVENSRLLLKCQIFVSPQAVKLAQDRLADLGYDLSRILLVPATADYMEQYLSVDIAFDTYPYPGGGTTCDALYMGVPVISLYGKQHGTRFGYSILKAVGIEDLAVETESEYIAKAISLTADGELLNLLHKNLRHMMLNSSLMDENAYMQDLEEVYKEIYRKSKQGL